MGRDYTCVNLDPIALHMASSLELNDVLTTITHGLVDEWNLY